MPNLSPSQTAHSSFKTAAILLSCAGDRAATKVSNTSRDGCLLEHDERAAGFGTQGAAGERLERRR